MKKIDFVIHCIQIHLRQERDIICFSQINVSHITPNICNTMNGKHTFEAWETAKDSRDVEEVMPGSLLMITSSMLTFHDILERSDSNRIRLYRLEM